MLHMKQVEDQERINLPHGLVVADFRLTLSRADSPTVVSPFFFLSICQAELDVDQYPVLNLQAS